MRTSASVITLLPLALGPALRAPLVSMLTTEWRLYSVEVAVEADANPPAYNRPLEVSEPLREAVAERLALPELEASQIRLIRRSLDARRTHRHAASVVWSHVVDVELTPRDARRLGLKPQPGRLVPAAKERAPAAAIAAASTPRHVAVVGAGPCGLFAALTLAQAGHKVTLLERGKPVELRGKSVGALMQRRILDAESNFCYGEGGAGTWSDGKLTTRIGRNSAEVRHVLETLVRFGAPERILLDGAPHLGTDNLVRLLKAFRAELIALGVEFRWDTRVASLTVEEAAEHGGRGRVRGVVLSDGEELAADAVVLAAGHSARELYVELIAKGAVLAPKDFAVGFRVEHPQHVINEARYGDLAVLCHGKGHGPLPPASYRLAATVKAGAATAAATEAAGGVEAASPEATERGVYSFCMCPGGQIVPTSLRPSQLCINGMSYSNRGSKWANSAVVASVGASLGDFAGFTFAGAGEGDDVAPLAGLAFQEAMEARAAEMGGGGLVCPVQRVSDFLAGVPSDPAALPPSSYRLGVRAAPLHLLYPPVVTAALRDGLARFARTLPGFDCDQALLHGVETRTSAPVQIARDATTLEAASLPGLFPAGEGAGYAGGIVSAAVDGLRVARCLLQHLEAAAIGSE